MKSTIQQIQDTITAISEIGNSSSEDEVLPPEFEQPPLETPQVSPLVLEMKLQTPPVPPPRISSKPASPTTTAFPQDKVKITVLEPADDLVVTLNDEVKVNVDSPRQDKDREIPAIRSKSTLPRQNSSKSITTIATTIDSRSLSSFSSGSRAAIFTVTVDNLPKNNRKTALRIGYQCDPFIRLFLANLLAYDGRDYYKKHAKKGIWKFKLRKSQVLEHDHGTLKVYDKSDKYGDVEVGQFKFLLKALNTNSILRETLQNGTTRISVQAQYK